MKYLQFILILGLTLALTTTEQSGILDPNDMMFQQEDSQSTINVREQQIETKNQQWVAQEFIQDNNSNEVMTEAELEHALITKDDLNNIPDIQMGTQNALFLQKRKN
ncbi:unnamed protein product (macronuclear) [Paramecium tetraurelia]|uniref:EF-hand domain-containing protein n=1 Tax=Paramecium tetraurelia TaxID=5888 RepID=A0E4M6_PARTE|nr:uncharacterized protein GSPATT00023418001 [Paramecium tetraurelia]CAK90243.1 unnamed protein product [Paramecium tetraurelia]|eukprot:XP_001457640.1 hypothetical protein (macronuclear) [Paramecium tetraurelia strain d4-2]